MLAEAFHAAADSVNVVLLGVSLRRSRQPADVEHPLGYGGARFLWAFLAAISSFLIGGCLSIALAVHDLLHGAAVGRFSVAWVVLGVAALADGSSLVQTLRQARREAAFWGQTTIGYLRHTSDPTLRALAVEDSAALAGNRNCRCRTAGSPARRPARSDAIASLLIGVLLAATAVGLARPLADLLIGKSIPPDRLHTAHAILAGSPGIDQVLTMHAAYVAPQEVILAAKVHPAAGRRASSSPSSSTSSITASATPSRRSPRYSSTPPRINCPRTLGSCSLARPAHSGPPTSARAFSEGAK